MAKRSSPVSCTSVDKKREICLDLDVPPVPRGWERCLDLKSGLLYLKEMEHMRTGRQSHSDRQKKSSSPKILDILRPRRDSVTLTGVETKGGHKNHSKFTQQGTEISTSALQRQKLLSSNENDGLSLQLSLSLPSCDSYSVKPEQNSQNGDKMPRPQLELDSLSSSLDRCSSSASSFSDAGNETKFSTEVDFKKKNFSGPAHAEGKSSHSLKKMMAAGCPHCLMFVLLSKDNPRCPKCGSSILFDLPAPQKDDNGIRNP